MAASSTDSIPAATQTTVMMVGQSQPLMTIPRMAGGTNHAHHGDYESVYVQRRLGRSGRWGEGQTAPKAES